MATIILQVCDICKDRDKPTTTYTVETVGQKVSLELCEDDSRPLRALLTRFGSKVKARKPKATAGYSKYLATTIEEVEAQRVN